MLTIAGGILLAALALGFIYGAYHFGRERGDTEQDAIGLGLWYAIGACVIVAVVGVILAKLGRI